MTSRIVALRNTYINSVSIARTANPSWQYKLTQKQRITGIIQTKAKDVTPYAGTMGLRGTDLEGSFEKERFLCSWRIR